MTEGTDSAAVFTVTMDPSATEAILVDYATQDGTAIAPGDYQATSGTLTFEAGETEKMVSIPIVDDTEPDSDETFTFALSNARGGPTGAVFVHPSNVVVIILNHEVVMPPLTAEFSDVPAHHENNAFTLTLALSEAFNGSDATIRDHALRVTGGRITGVEAEQANQAWLITVEPEDGTHVSVTLPATTDCAATGAICTSDGRALSTAITASVAYEPPPPPPLTAQLVGVPEEHDGEGTIIFEVRFSEEPHGYSYRTLRDHTLDIRQGETRITPRLKRLQKGSNLRWRVTITPVSNADMTLTLSAPTSCSHATSVCTEDGRALSGTVTATIAAKVTAVPELSVADTLMIEHNRAALNYPVTMNQPATEVVTVDYATSDGTATAGRDYRATSGTLTFAPGETSKIASVRLMDDSIDDANETVILTLSNASGGNAIITDATGVGIIENDDPMPQNWLVRFGRTVASQAVDAIGGRMGDGRSSHVTVGGQSLSLSGEKMTPEAREEMEQALEAFAGTNGESVARSMSGEEALRSTSFQLSAGGENGEVGFTGWGEVSTNGFQSDVDGTQFDGNVSSAFLGADVGTDRWLAGLALSLSRGKGDYVLMDGDDRGDVESSLTTVYPYAQIGLTDRVDVWGLAGWGQGELTLTQHANEERDAARYTTDISMQMGAVGARGEVLSPGEAGGLSIAIKSDAFWVRTESDAVSNSDGTLGASEGDASRVRLLMEASRLFETGGGGAFTPGLEVGLRHDGGDAETGTGIEAGASLRYQGAGITIEGAVRTLVAHEESGYEEWGASGAIRIDPGQSGRGLSLTLSPTWGAAASGVDKLWGLRDAKRLAGNREFEAETRMEGEVGYGIGVPHTLGLVTPYAGLSVSDGGTRILRTGTRWQLSDDATLGVEATRSEDRDQRGTSGFVFRAATRW